MEHGEKLAKGQTLKRHCKPPQRPQSYSVELIFAPWLNKISGLTWVLHQR